jgi:filamentous hemagglutinin family protein
MMYHHVKLHIVRIKITIYYMVGNRGQNRVVKSPSSSFPPITYYLSMIKHRHLLLTAITLLLLPDITQAQTYTPSNRPPRADNSIGTVVNPTGANNFNITGGLQRGQNLFHSFTDFSVPTGSAAIFDNPAGRSIITRVTGISFSDINGLIDTNRANFLLINPNGVVFGTGVNLNVGKAFVVSTASGVDFIDAQGQNYNFGVNRAGDALLSIGSDVGFNPVRLIMAGSNSGSKGIESYGNISRGLGEYTGLIGGNVTFNGADIYAGGGKVELGGLRQSGSIGFSFDNGIQFPANVERGNVSLLSNATSNNSEIYVRSGGGGSVSIFAKDITIKGNDTGIKAGIGDGAGSATAKAGDIKIDAIGTIDLADGAIIYNLVGAGGTGTGGGIDIQARNLSAKNGAQIYTNTQAKGAAGNIKIATSGDILFDGGSEGNRSGVLSDVKTTGEGKAGNIEIATRNLSVTNGSQIFASTYGKGDAGNIKITASGDILFDGGVDATRSGVLSRVESTGIGKAGNIEIGTNNLFITNSAGLSTSTEGKGNAGNIKVNATGDIQIDGRKTNVLINGNRFDVSSTIYNIVDGNGIAEGKGGDIDIVARNLSITNGGSLNVSTYGKGDAGNIKITAIDGTVSFDGGIEKIQSSASSRVEPKGVGKAGDIDIVARNLSVTNGAAITTSMEGTGSAGDISLKSNTINLSQGEISSKSFNSTGGNTNLFSTDYLLLRNNSLIVTDSDSTGKKSNGGNITINSPLIIATPGNNDITANAYEGKGGRVNITSQGLFGIQYRPGGGSNLTNDITVSSTFGPSGIVQINTPGVDPGKDTGELPAAPNDASRQISQTCSASQRDNKFYITGRGGLPPNASEPQESEALWQDAREIKTKPATTANQPAQLAPPAIGWVFEKNGRVRLIAAQTPREQMGSRTVCPNR